MINLKLKRLFVFILAMFFSVNLHAEGLTEAQKRMLQETPNPRETYGVIMNKSDGYLRISDENGIEMIDKTLEKMVLSKCKIGDRCKIVGWSDHAGRACDGIHGTCTSFWKIKSVSKEK